MTLCIKDTNAKWKACGPTKKVFVLDNKDISFPLDIYTYVSD